MRSIRKWRHQGTDIICYSALCKAWPRLTTVRHVAMSPCFRMPEACYSGASRSLDYHKCGMQTFSGSPTQGFFVGTVPSVVHLAQALPARRHLPSATHPPGALPCLLTAGNHSARPTLHQTCSTTGCKGRSHGRGQPHTREGPGRKGPHAGRHDRWHAASNVVGTMQAR